MTTEVTLAQILRGVVLGRTRRPAAVSYTPDGAPGAPVIDVSAPPPDDIAAIARGIAGGLPGGIPGAATLRRGGRCFSYRITSEIFPANRATTMKNRVAVVTGAAQGLGAEIARGLAAGGAIVHLADTNAAGAARLAEQFNAGCGGGAAAPVAFAHGADVADEESVARLCEDIALRSGGLDLCVSNAGIVRGAGGILGQDIAALRLVAEVNYVGFAVVAKHAGGMMKTQHIAAGAAAPGAAAWTSDIIQINSKSGLEGSGKNGAYAGSKFGGVGLVQSFAKELVEWGIKVNAVCPGNFFDGPLWSEPERGLFAQYLRAGKVPGARTAAEVRAFYEAKTPMGRGCGAADVLRAVYYLVEQQYETGQALPVTGGQVMLN
ncbi:SDR family NAD(P)-dependent oxidoreductase [Termitidicoccus mucosus]|uniref:Sorbitol-6-phosphate 2-dehydrogenase n=1 Tax=Termitidicoccus mucosus TaxID=1184151 RepID=A0A178IGI6_9BACT|nr:hypothetical protein AW736_18875 [Opitutaceae bacterium TSB47]